MRLLYKYFWLLAIGSLVPHGSALAQEAIGNQAEAIGNQAKEGKTNESVASAPGANAPGTRSLNPSEFLNNSLLNSDQPKVSEDQLAKESLKQSYVFIKGSRYLRLQSKDGTILLPDLTHYTNADINEAKCEPFYRGEKPAAEETVAAQAEVNLTHNIKLYAASIMHVIKTKCQDQHDSNQLSPFVAPNLEVGVEFQGKKKSSPKVRVYNKSLQPEVGASVEF